MPEITYIVHNCPTVNFEDRQVTLTGQKAIDTIKAIKSITGWFNIEIGVYIKKLAITVLETKE